jgi:glycosyltransferase involved in cell wall biosynthesis
MISIFVPTSGRPAYFREMLRTLRETTFGYDVEVVAVIDADEEAAEIAYEYGVETIDYSNTRRGALNAWNLGLSLCSGEWYVPAGDDQVFHKNWLKYAIQSFEDKLDGYGVLGMNDLAYDGNMQVATMWMFDRAYCKEHMGGMFAPPMYHYYCIDMEWNQKAKDLGYFYWEPKSIVEHLHSAHGKRPVDTTDSYKEDKWMEIDNKTFRDRWERSFPIEWESLI